MSEFVCSNISVNENGNLCFAGFDVTELANDYQTPLYVFDENRIRENCRVYRNAFKKYFGQDDGVLYASKACSFKQMIRIVAEEGMGIDVVSAGEIYTAYEAGFDLSRAYFHGNNKTDEEIDFAISRGIGYFVVDNEEELLAINEMCKEKNVKQKILIRLTPGIDTHTYEAVNTGKVDSKFGFAIETGQAFEIVKEALKLSNIDIYGFHCHVGSQVFYEDVFERSAAIMLEFLAKVKKELGLITRELNLGGGYGVRYVESDEYIDIDAKISDVACAVKEYCAKLSLDVPKILMEPGRSIVADAGMTLYKAGGVKVIPGYKNYVSIDGGMSDNPRFALYGSKYTCFVANKMLLKRDFEASLVGKCCESGDIIQENVLFPSNVKRGDVIAVCTTGAYNYSMASNYNRIGRPAVLMLKNEDGKKTSYFAVKRENFANLVALDL